MQVCICGLVLWLHPKPLVHTPTFTWTVTFAGVCCGFALGLQGVAPPDASPLPHIEAGSWYMLRLVAAASWRVVVGALPLIVNVSMQGRTLQRDVELAFLQDMHLFVALLQGASVRLLTS